MSEKIDIIFLGTGNALTTRCYNTCFILRSQGSQLMVDAGGGNGSNLSRLEFSARTYMTCSLPTRTPTIFSVWYG